jgi:hypothetical protein
MGEAFRRASLNQPLCVEMALRKGKVGTSCVWTLARSDRGVRHEPPKGAWRIR